MHEAKREMRQKMIAARTGTPGAARATADVATWKALRDFLIGEVPEGAVVAAYRPFGAEPGATLEPQLPERLTVSYRVIVPVLLPDRDLAWEAVGDGGGEPGEGPAEEPVGIEAAAVVVAPGLAVSPDGTRLGRGGGSYDRALARVAPEVPVVALVRDAEFGLAVPAEEHDRRVSAVVTPGRGFVRLR